MEKQSKNWEGRWLPSLGTVQVQSPNKILPRLATIKELIQDAASELNEELIKAIFWVDEVKAILSIPLGSTHLEDKLTWVLIENGAFTVKIAFFFSAINRKKQTRWGSIQHGVAKQQMEIYLAALGSSKGLEFYLENDPQFPTNIGEYVPQESGGQSSLPSVPSRI